ncbi:VOC family protein [Saccharopolyspora taberi]|uniref:Glyoxalase-like domain-containing protein n=1 Tax=Saccharopolyspora taberi TaxID=60895 RepID=A0ABN3VHY0_9PSEU
MPQHTAVRGLRRAELITADPLATLTFHEALLGWVPLASGSGFDCWVGDRRCASVRTPKAGERTELRVVFAGAAHDGSLTGPDDTSAEMTRGRAQHGPWAPGPRKGEPCWVELFAADTARADAFWAGTLNWTVAESLYEAGGRVVAGRSDRQIDGRWGWLCYFAVEDIDVAGNRVLELGGAVVEWTKHPVIGEAVVISDPAGAVCALASTGESWGGQRSESSPST